MAEQTQDSRAVEQRNAVLRQLQDQLQFARLKGNTAEVERLQAEIDDINAGPETPVLPSGSAAPDQAQMSPGPQSVADIVNSYEQPRSTGESYETVTKAPPVSDDIVGLGRAPKYKQTFVAPDFTGLESVGDVLKRNEEARTTERQAAEAKGEAARKGFGEEEAKARQRYGEGKTRNEWLDVAERVAAAAAQYGAARQGLATGANLSNLPIERTDYSRKTDQLLAEMKSELDSVRERRAEAERRGDREAARGEAALDRTLSASVKDLENRRTDREEEAKARSRALEGENRFAEDIFRTEESGRARVQAAKERGKERSEREEDRKREREEAAKTKADLAKTKAETAASTKAQETLDKNWGEIEGATELIGSSDIKERIKGRQKLAKAAGTLGLDKETQSEIMDLSLPASMFKGEFSTENKRDRLAAKLGEVRKQLEGMKGQKAAPPPTVGQKMVKVRAPNGQTRMMTEAEAAPFVAKGATIVP